MNVHVQPALSLDRLKYELRSIQSQVILTLVSFDSTIVNSFFFIMITYTLKKHTTTLLLLV